MRDEITTRAAPVDCHAMPDSAQISDNRKRETQHCSNNIFHFDFHGEFMCGAFGGWWGHIRNNNNNYTFHHHRTPLRHSSGSQPLLVFICFGGAESARLRSGVGCVGENLICTASGLCESFNCTKQDIKRSREEYSYGELVVGADIESSVVPVPDCTMQADYSETLIAFAN